MPTIIKATNDAYGMLLDLGGVDAVHGTVFDGKPLSTISATPLAVLLSTFYTFREALFCSALQVILLLVTTTTTTTTNLMSAQNEKLYVSENNKQVGRRC